ncbi:hypothetical protein [Streptomyces sp. NPDC057094]|uniref:hypothetical protein n=1 Tax=Streptomyces sp. NPDC057094 TaxID=3346018 RepID=UPI00362DD67C
MRVDVAQICSLDDRIVYFTCAVGSSFARWMGSGPVGVGQFHVEIEIPEEVAEWSVDASRQASVSTVDEVDVLVTGEVVRLGEDGDPVVEVRLGTDILLVEMARTQRELVVNEFISFRVTEIQLYPYEV